MLGRLPNEELMSIATIPDPQGLIRVTNGTVGKVDIEQTESIMVTSGSDLRPIAITMDPELPLKFVPPTERHRRLQCAHLAPTGRFRAAS